MRRRWPRTRAIAVPAHAALASVYARFNQGFGTPLLVEAKALRDELR